MALARAGMDVGVTWHSDEIRRERHRRGGSQSAGRRAEVARLDTSALDTCGAVIDDLAERLGGLDVYVHNPGTGTSELFVDMSLADWRQVVATDLDGAFVASSAPPG